MKKELPVKQIELARIKFLLTALLIFACLISNGQADKENTDPKLTLVRSVPIDGSVRSATKEIAGDALYSNITTLQFPVPNEGAENRGGNIITDMVADSIAFEGGSAPFSIKQIYFTASNLNYVDISARILIRFYEADGENGRPGTYITGLTFGPVNIPARKENVFTANTNPSVLTTKNRAIYAGIIFDNNNGGTGATIDQMNELGQGMYNPIDVGSSSDAMFVTDSAGLYDSSHPAGRIYSFMGVQINLGWQLISAVALPITLKDFQVTNQGTFNHLKWSTSQESNSSHFIIERSADGNNFNEIGRVNAADNTSLPIQYQFTDENPLNGMNYYRLKMVDKDNSQKVSTIVSVRNFSTSKMNIYPNPSKSLITIEFITDKTENAQIDVTDMNGTKVLQSHVVLTSGNNKIPLNIGKLPAGMYNVNVNAASGNQSIKISKL